MTPAEARLVLTASSLRGIAREVERKLPREKTLAAVLREHAETVDQVARNGA